MTLHEEIFNKYIGIESIMYPNKFSFHSLDFINNKEIQNDLNKLDFDINLFHYEVELPRHVFTNGISLTKRDDDYLYYIEKRGYFLDDIKYSLCFYMYYLTYQYNYLDELISKLRTNNIGDIIHINELTININNMIFFNFYIYDYLNNEFINNKKEIINKLTERYEIQSMLLDEVYEVEY